MNKIELLLSAHNYKFKTILHYIRLDEAYFKFKHNIFKSSYKSKDFLMGKQTLRIAGYDLNAWSCVLVLPLRRNSAMVNCNVTMDSGNISEINATDIKESTIYNISHVISLVNIISSELKVKQIEKFLEE